MPDFKFVEYTVLEIRRTMSHPVPPLVGGVSLK